MIFTFEHVILDTMNITYLSTSCPSLASKIYIYVAAVLCIVTQSCPTLCDPMNCSPPGSSVPVILQGRILEWAAMPSFRGSSQPRDQTQVSHISGGLFTSEPPGKPKNPGVSSLSLPHIYTSIHT